MKRFYKKLIVILAMCCLITSSTAISVEAFDTSVNMLDDTENVVMDNSETEATTTETITTEAITTETITTEVTTTEIITTEVITTETTTQTDKIEAEDKKDNVTTQATTVAENNLTTATVALNNSNSAPTTAPTTSEEATTEEVDPRESYTTHTLNVEEGRIEQVQAVKPKVRAYFYYNDSTLVLSPENVEAKLGDSRITVDKIYRWGQESQLHINYYILLDVSGSMNNSYFEAAKKEIALFPTKQMKAGDTLTVYAVGDSTELIVEDCTYDDMRLVEDEVMKLTNEANETYLDEAILEVVEDVKKDREACGNELPQSRDVIIAFTDGVNESMVGATQNEAETALKNSGVTMYGFIENDVTADNSDAAKKFGEVARSTGGQEYYFNDEDVAEKLSDLSHKLGEAYVLEGTARDNEVSNSLERFNITIYHDDNKEILLFEGKDVMVDKHIPDNTAPQVEYIKMIDDTKLEIKFSESVEKADDRASYVLTKDDGTNIGIENVQYNEKNDIYILYASETIYKGTYIVIITGVTDSAMEKNPLAQTEFTQEFDGPEFVEEKESFFQKYWWIVLIIFIVIVIIILVVVFVVIKKNKGVVVIDNKATLASNTEVKQHIILQNEEEGEKLTLILNSKGKSVKTIQASVKGSVIVGRSDLCDIYIDDLAMSRQHFAIEFDGESFYVQDLDTTNGTSLNGIRLTHKRRLEPNDKITAGSLDITVRW